MSENKSEYVLLVERRIEADLWLHETCVPAHADVDTGKLRKAVGQEVVIKGRDVRIGRTEHECEDSWVVGREVW